jgi:hypothetical protein
VFVAVAAVLLVAVVAGALIIALRNPVEQSAQPSVVAEAPIEPPDVAPENALQVYYEKFTLAAPGTEAPPPATDAAVNDAIEALEKANPDLDNFQVFYNIRDGFVSLDMSGNPKLVDISPVKGIPLRELRIQGTGVIDLTPLKGLPLEKLVLSDTPVADLDPLRGLPLKELSLWECRNVTDVSPLVDLKGLTRLLLPEQLASLGPLRDHPSLQYLANQPDGWSQTAGEFWARVAKQQP